MQAVLIHLRFEVAEGSARRPEPDGGVFFFLACGMVAEADGGWDPFAAIPKALLFGVSNRIAMAGSKASMALAWTPSAGGASIDFATGYSRSPSADNSDSGVGGFSVGWTSWSRAGVGVVLIVRYFQEAARIYASAGYSPDSLVRFAAI
jgi:hypothetical protein